MSANPFFAQSDLPYQLPPFELIEEEHYRPAFERGMADQLAEVAAISHSPEPATFENTVVALEFTGRLLRRASYVFFNQVAADTDPSLQEIEAELAPKLAAHRDSIVLDSRLFARISSLHENKDSLGLDAESTWLLSRYHLDFVRAGAKLSEAEKERLRSLNQELSSLSTEFSKNLLAETVDSAVVISSADELAGLSDEAISAAAVAAKDRGLEGSYVLTLQNFTLQPVLSYLDNPEVRERVYRAGIQRGIRGNDNDSTGIVRRMANLRAERAKLLGYDSHAAYCIEDNTARSVDAVADILAKLTPPAVANAIAEGHELEAIAAGADSAAENAPAAEKGALGPWDWGYYSDRVRREKYDLDTDALRPYFELDRVLNDGVFFAAGQLYGLRFEERPDLAGYRPDVRVFEVFNEDGSGLGLFLADFFKRDSKNGGAWCSSFVHQSTLLGTSPVTTVNLNIVPPSVGCPALLTVEEVRTLFHEFGHALHNLFSSVTYPRFAGTAVPRDFVEYPSQVNEMWQFWPEVLANYAKHHETGEPLPAELVGRLLATRKFNQGFATTEYLAAALLDQAWHTLAADAAEIEDVEEFEAAALTQAGVALPLVLPRYRTGYFSHIFGGGYSAQYYSYIWSEVLDADTVAWFEENGGLTRTNGDHFRRTLLSRGGSLDPMDAYRQFRGRDPEIEPLLERRGLTG